MMPKGHKVKRKGGWTPRPFEERKRQVFISGIPQKYLKEFNELAAELKEMFLYVKEKK